MTSNSKTLALSIAATFILSSSPALAAAPTTAAEPAQLQIAKASKKEIREKRRAERKAKREARRAKRQQRRNSAN
jgi:hypothetical protein